MGLAGAAGAVDGRSGDRPRRTASRDASRPVGAGRVRDRGAGAQHIFRAHGTDGGRFSEPGRALLPLRAAGCQPGAAPGRRRAAPGRGDAGRRRPGLRAGEGPGGTGGAAARLAGPDAGRRRPRRARAARAAGDRRGGGDAEGSDGGRVRARPRPGTGPCARACARADGGSTATELGSTGGAGLDAGEWRLRLARSAGRRAERDRGLRRAAVDPGLRRRRRSGPAGPVERAPLVLVARTFRFPTLVPVACVFAPKPLGGFALPVPPLVAPAADALLCARARAPGPGPAGRRSADCRRRAAFRGRRPSVPPARAPRRLPARARLRSGRVTLHLDSAPWPTRCDRCT